MSYGSPESVAAWLKKSRPADVKKIRDSIAADSANTQVWLDKIKTGLAGNLGLIYMSETSDVLNIGPAPIDYWTRRILGDILSP